jgi:hypothetical protein
MLRTGGTLQFDVTLPFWITESSCSQALMSPRWWWQMHGQSAPMQGQQGRRGKTALTSGSYFHNSTVFGRRREGKKISLVTTTGRCFFIIAQRGDAVVAAYFHSISWTEPGRRSRK